MMSSWRQVQREQQLVVCRTTFNTTCQSSALAKAETLSRQTPRHITRKRNCYKQAISVMLLIVPFSRQHPVFKEQYSIRHKPTASTQPQHSSELHCLYPNHDSDTIISLRSYLYTMCLFLALFIASESSHDLLDRSSRKSDPD